MLANIGARAQHTGCRFELINQDGVVIFPAGEVHRLAGRNVQRFEVRSGHVNDIQRRQRLLPDGDKFGGQAIAARGGCRGHVPARL